MKKLLKKILFVFFLLLSVAILLKGWWIYQNKYVCGPQVRVAVEKLLTSVRANEFETLKDNSMFIDKTQFKEIKNKMANSYSLTIKDWGGDGAAYTIVKFSNGTEYALMVIPTEMNSLSCWGVEYKVLTIAR